MKHLLFEHSQEEKHADLNIMSMLVYAGASYPSKSNIEMLITKSRITICFVVNQSPISSVPAQNEQPGGQSSQRSSS